MGTVERFRGFHSIFEKERLAIFLCLYYLASVRLTAVGHCTLEARKAVPVILRRGRPAEVNRSAIFFYCVFMCDDVNLAVVWPWNEVLRHKTVHVFTRKCEIPCKPVLSSACNCFAACLVFNGLAPSHIRYEVSLSSSCGRSDFFPDFILIHFLFLCFRYDVIVISLLLTIFSPKKSPLRTFSRKKSKKIPRKNRGFRLTQKKLHSLRKSFVVRLHIFSFSA